MKKFLFITFLPLAFIGCVNPSNPSPTNKIPEKHTSVVVEPSTASKSSTNSNDHRYDSRYRNFNYDRLGYSNNNGIYYGYYDNQGYFYNNQYFTYDDRYNYNDRYNRRGYFDPNYNPHRNYNCNEEWNKNHICQNGRENPRVYHPQDGQIYPYDLSYQNSRENVENRQR